MKVHFPRTKNELPNNGMGLIALVFSSIRGNRHRLLNCNPYPAKSLKSEIITCSLKSSAQFSASWQLEFSPGNLKRRL